MYTTPPEIVHIGECTVNTHPELSQCEMTHDIHVKPVGFFLWPVDIRYLVGKPGHAVFAIEAFPDACVGIGAEKLQSGPQSCDIILGDMHKLAVIM